MERGARHSGGPLRLVVADSRTRACSPRLPRGSVSSHYFAFVCGSCYASSTRRSRPKLRPCRAPRSMRRLRASMHRVNGSWERRPKSVQGPMRSVPGALQRCVLQERAAACSKGWSCSISLPQQTAPGFLGSGVRSGSLPLGSVLVGALLLNSASSGPPLFCGLLFTELVGFQDRIWIVIQSVRRVNHRRPLHTGAPPFALKRPLAWCGA